MRAINFAGVAVAVLAIASAPILTADEADSTDLAVAVAESLPLAPVSALDVKVSTLSLAHPGVTLKKPRITSTATTAGYPATGVPCYACDPNAGYTIAIPIPISQWVVGTTADVTVQWDNVNYTGACSATYALVQGATTVANGSVSGTCNGDTVSQATFTVTIPAVKGATRVVGTIHYGAKKSSSSTLIFINNGQ